jgi:hypothetical protein
MAAAAITLVLVVFVYGVLLQYPLAGKSRDKAVPLSPGKRLEEGARALSQGKFRLAVQELEAVEQVRNELPVPERKRLTQLHRQAAVLADLLSEALGDILHQAADLTELDEQEWYAVFRERYLGRSVVFDAFVRRDPGGKYYLDYTVFVRGRAARLDISDVHLLGALPLQKQERLLLGMRLAAIRLEPGGVWLVRFQPDSGVLLTDAGAVAACFSHLPDELNAVLHKQKDWVP